MKLKLKKRKVTDLKFLLAICVWEDYSFIKLVEFYPGGVTKSAQLIIMQGAAYFVQHETSFSLGIRLFVAWYTTTDIL